MLECPKSSLDTVRRVYPMIKAITWNRRKNCFEIFEEISEDACLRLRRILDYQNADGTPVPFIGDRAIELLRRADTRCWPLAERMAIFDKEEEELEKRQDKEMAESVGARIMEDYHYIAGIPTFFFGDDMKVARAKHMPIQDRILRSRGMA